MPHPYLSDKPGAVRFFICPGLLIPPRSEKLSLLILGILLEEENGVQLAKNMRRNGSTIPILFITSSADFVYEGYTAEPVGYLLKPADPEKLEEALLRAYKKHRQKAAVIHTPVQTVSFQLDDVLYMEINDKTLSIHLAAGNVLKAAARLCTLSGILPPEQFVQCHRSYIVSLAAISSICRYSIELKNREIIPVSKKRYKDVQNALLAWAASFELP